MPERITPFIRTMEPEDFDDVYQMGHGAPEFSLSDEANFWSENELKRWIIDQRDDVLLVASLDIKLVGFSLAMYHDRTKLGTCTNVFIRPGYRRRGIGKTLLTETVRRLEERGAAYIDSLVHPHNEASIKLHEAAGFRQGYLMRTMERIPPKETK